MGPTVQPGSRCGAGDAAAGEGTLDVGTAAGPAPVGPAAMAASTSCLVMRPPVPVPAIDDRSSSCSAASLRTNGERTWERGPRSCSAGAAVAAAAAGAWAAGGAACGVGTGSAVETAGTSAAGSSAESAASAAGVAGDAAAPSPESISASSVPTATVSPSGTRIFVTVPATGEGTSVSTLSVEISKSGSSRSIVSPSCLSHFRMVPSMIVSPSCGIWIEVTGARLLGFGPGGHHAESRSTAASMSAICGR